MKTRALQHSQQLREKGLEPTLLDYTTELNEVEYNLSLKNLDHETISLLKNFKKELIKYINLEEKRQSKLN